MLGRYGKDPTAFKPLVLLNLLTSESSRKIWPEGNFLSWYLSTSLVEKLTVESGLRGFVVGAAGKATQAEVFGDVAFQRAWKLYRTYLGRPATGGKQQRGTGKRKAAQLDPQDAGETSGTRPSRRRK